MDEYNRGKILAGIVNKYKFTFIDKLRIVLYISFIPICYFIFIKKSTDITYVFFLWIYISFVSLLFIIFEITKYYYVQKKEKDLLRNLIHHNLENLFLMIPFLVFDPIFGFFSSKEFRRGFRDTYWATKLYYLIYLVAFLIAIPFILLSLYSLGALFLNFIR